MTDPIAVVAEGGLSRLKEIMRTLEQRGVTSQVLPPADGCLNK